MAVTVLAVQNIVGTGLSPSYTAANTDGHTIVNDGVETLFHVKNGSGGALTCTFVTTASWDSLALTDLAVSVPAGEERMIGPFPKAYYGASMTVTFSGVTSLTVAAFKLIAR